MEMYKLKYFITAILVVGVVASKGIAGIILIDIVEVLFFVIEMIWWREDKYNWKLRILDFVLTLLAYNTACLITYNTPVLHALIIISVYGILLIKSYYVITAFIEKRREEAEVKPEEKVAPAMQVGEESPERKANPNIISIESSIDQARPEMPNVIEDKGDSVDEKYYDKFGIDYENVLDFRNFETIDHMSNS